MGDIQFLFINVCVSRLIYMRSRVIYMEEENNKILCFNIVSLLTLYFFLYSKNAVCRMSLYQQKPNV